MLAAALLTVISFHWLFAATAIGFPGSAVVVLSVVLPRSPAKRRSGDTYIHTMRGIRFCLKTPRLRGMLAVNLAAATASAMVMVVVMVMVMVIVNTVVIVRNVFGYGQREVALTLAAYGGGSMLAALALPRLLDRIADRIIMLSAAAALAAILGVFALISLVSWPTLLAG